MLFKPVIPAKRFRGNAFNSSHEDIAHYALLAMLVYDLWCTSMHQYCCIDNILTKQFRLRNHLAKYSVALHYYVAFTRYVMSLVKIKERNIMYYRPLNHPVLGKLIVVKWSQEWRNVAHLSSLRSFPDFFGIGPESKNAWRLQVIARIWSHDS